MNFLKAGMHKLPEYMQLRQAVESNALPAVATGLSGIHKATIINALVQDTNKTALLLAADEAEAQPLWDCVLLFIPQEILHFAM